jgi:signal transduction histidine kinase/PAS domain-containing protein/ActR/RegA family two-component response regulator
MPTTYELEVISRAGRRVPLEVSSRLIVRDGRPVGIQGIARDITERKRAEADRERLLKELESERAFLEAVLRQMPGGIVIAEAASGKIVLRSQQGPSLLPGGKEPPESVKQYDSLANLLPGGRYASPKGWPLLRSLRSGEEVAGEEMDFRREDGSLGTLRASSAPVRAPDGTIIAAVATWFDITERKRGEEIQRFLAESSAALAGSLDYEVTLQQIARLAVPALADWCAVDMLLDDQTVRRVAVVHRDPEKVDLGQELLRRYPLRLEGPEGTVLRQQQSRLLAEITDAHLSAYARDAAHLEVLRGLGLKSCILVPLLAPPRDLSGKPGRQPGQVLGAISLVAAESGRRYGPADLAVAEELARRAALAVENARLYRELQEADRRKDEFLAMLAHELRNPLAPIRNAGEILKMVGDTHPELKRVRALIERQVTHLARLVDDLLDVSRITRGKVLLRKERLDLTALVRTVAEDLRSLLATTGLELTAELPERPLWVEGDPTRLAQVVGNLLHNANKFTDAGGRVHVRLTIDGNGEQAMLAVRDTGIGLEAEILNRLFQPFSQADRSLDRTRGGLGLGLALVKELVELHGGSVQAASRGAGQGSEFTVRLPLSRPSSGAKGMSDGPRARGRSLRILIIEDNRDAAESLRMLLQLSGHQVAVAHSGQAGMESAGKLCPDVVLCDIGLPGGMDGYAVARALRADPEQAVATLIALSGYGQEEDQRQAQQAGFDRHLIKPVDPGMLRQLLATLPLRADSNRR